MENGNNGNGGGLNFGDAGVLALLADTNRAGRGGYGWGGEGGYGGGYGNIANAVRLDRNAQEAGKDEDCTRTLFGQAFDSIQGAFENGTRQNQFNRLCDRIGDVDLRNTDNQFRAELRTNDRLLALQAEMNNNARVAAQCCCDLKLQACNDKSELMAEIKAVESRGVLRDLDRAERQLQTQTIISTCGCGCGGGVRPCPPQ